MEKAIGLLNYLVLNEDSSLLSQSEYVATNTNGLGILEIGQTLEVKLSPPKNDLWLLIGVQEVANTAILERFTQTQHDAILL